MLVAADTPNHQFLREVNRTLSVPSGVPTIFAFIDGRVVRLMRVLPGATACFECMHHRMRAGKTFWREFDATTSGAALWYQDQPAEPVLQAHQLAAATLMQATLMLAGQVHDLHHNSVIELDGYGQAQTKSPVLKLPRCPVCGPGAANKPMPPIYTAKE
jgi:bacteriocin biosynthesis cyclodehydratase domain-containing protein